jgi:hypothetical protein
VVENLAINEPKTSLLSKAVKNIVGKSNRFAGNSGKR